MNTDWSAYIQGVGTLHQSRTLRFSDRFRAGYMDAFSIPDGQRILELGCGTGALAQALRRWYPRSRIVGLDRDSAFVAFAREHCPAAEFLEGDAEVLCFPEESFDVTISHTVAEHVDPERFFAGQYRVLRPGGTCLVLSVRRSIAAAAPCLAGQTDLEKAIWERVSDRFDEIERRTGMGSNPMDERAYPLCMERHGFRNVSTTYLTVALTPDGPDCPPETARAIIQSERQSALDAVAALEVAAGDMVSGAELDRMRAQIGGRYDERLALYDRGEKQWDTWVTLLMVLRGGK